MPSLNRELLISADAHVAENEDLRARLPEKLRDRMPLLVLGEGGDFDVEMNGEVKERSSWKKLSARDRELEFRSDPSLGTDLDRRMRDMAREGVDAQVIFPNIALDCGGSHQTREYSKAFARAYNEYVRETFASYSGGFVTGSGCYCLPDSGRGRQAKERRVMTDIRYVSEFGTFLVRRRGHHGTSRGAEQKLLGARLHVDLADVSDGQIGATDMHGHSGFVPVGSISPTQQLRI